MFKKIIHNSILIPEDDPSIGPNYIYGADNTTIAPYRWLDCQNAATRLISPVVHAQNGLVLDFAPGAEGFRGYYLHRILDKALAIRETPAYTTAFSPINYNPHSSAD